MRRRGAHCRCRPRPRYRVRRPIFGLVHGNYPPGLAATYHFIPKQTTLILYRLLRQIAIRFSPFLRNFFRFFLSRRLRNARRLAVFLLSYQNTIPGVSSFFRFPPVFPMEMAGSSFFFPNIHVFQGFPLCFLHTLSCVSSRLMACGAFFRPPSHGVAAFPPRKNAPGRSSVPAR